MVDSQLLISQTKNGVTGSWIRTPPPGPNQKAPAIRNGVIAVNGVAGPGWAGQPGARGPAAAAAAANVQQVNET